MPNMHISLHIWAYLGHPNEHGDLVIDSDELMKSEVVDISDPEGEEEEKELCDED